MGLISLALYMEISEYGFKALILKPNRDKAEQVYNMIEAGDLDGLKTLTRKITPENLVGMSVPG